MARVADRRAFSSAASPPDGVAVDRRTVGGVTVVSLRGSALSGPVVFDRSQVERVTPQGVRAWRELLDAAALTEGLLFRGDRHRRPRRQRDPRSLRVAARR